MQPSGMICQDQSFSDAGIDIEEVLEHRVIVTNLVLRKNPGKKTRRRMPRKQESLLRAVAEQGKLGFENLRKIYAKEWAKILERNKGQYLLVPKREFFRNIADLAGRVNSPLLKTLEDPELKDQLGDMSAAARVVLLQEHQRMSIGWGFLNPEGINSISVPDARSSSHCNLSGQKRANTRPITSTPDLPRDGYDDSPGIKSPSPAPKSSQPSSSVPPTIQNAPSGRKSLSTDEKDRHDILIEIDEITDYWKVTWEGVSVVLIPQMGYVQIGTCLIPFPDIQDLKEPEELNESILKKVAALKETSW